jgi:hypothetical protein
MDQSGYDEGVKLPDSDETDSIDSGNGGSSCSSGSGSGKSDYSNGSLAGNYSGIDKSTPDPIGSPPTNGYVHGSTSASLKEEPEIFDTRDEYIREESKSSSVKSRGKDRAREKEVKKEAKSEKNRERHAEKSPPKYLM